VSRELRKRCQRVVDLLGLPQPFSLELFLSQLESRRGRRIRLMPIQTHIALSGQCGLWIETEDVDFIFYDEDTTPFHQRLIIEHECAHIICADPESGMAAESLKIDELLPHLDPSLIQRVLGRDCYTDAQEEEAEMIASLIMSHDIRTAGAKPGVMGRLESVLGAGSHRPLK
jgi:hypothetical protein